MQKSIAMLFVLIVGVGITNIARSQTFEFREVSIDLVAYEYDTGTTQGWAATSQFDAGPFIYPEIAIAASIFDYVSDTQHVYNVSEYLRHSTSYPPLDSYTCEVQDSFAGRAYTTDVCEYLGDYSGGRIIRLYDESHVDFHPEPDNVMDFGQVFRFYRGGSNITAGTWVAISAWQ